VKLKYADAIEQAFYNALLGAMLPDGSDWAKYSPLSGQRMEGSQQCDMGLNCCVASGPRGLFTFPLTAVMGMDNGVLGKLLCRGRLFSSNSRKTNGQTGTGYRLPGDRENQYPDRIAQK